VKHAVKHAVNHAWLMVIASFLFATMGVCVKLASADYTPGEIMFYRGLLGAVLIFAFSRSRRIPLATRVPATHFWRSLTGVTAMFMWFYCLGNLPLATAMTLNYMLSVGMALFLLGGAAMLGAARVDGRLIGTVLLGFAGVAMILRPTIEQDQLWHGLVGLLSGMISAMAYLQVSALARAGEPEVRIVFYFSLGGSVFGLLTAFASGGLHAHTPKGAALLMAVGALATVAQLLMTRAYSSGHTLVVASLQYLGIAFSFGYGVLLFADRMTWLAVGGMMLIVGAGLAATLLRSRSIAPDTANAPLES
jgi:drug/metabolite transporter (DMT)-like permease